MNLLIPDSAFSDGQYKRKFTVAELYSALVLVPRAALTLARNRRRRLIDGEFVERIMLAVTEVNGCAACSWAHTQMALNQGMSSEEITSLLGGETTHVRPEEAKGLMFAQHYADTKGLPGESAYRVLVDEYGSEKARVIVSAAQIMMVGNIVGIAYSAFESRRRGRPYPGSSLAYELGLQLAVIPLAPLALLHAMGRWILGRPNMRYGPEKDDVGDAR